MPKMHPFVTLCNTYFGSSAFIKYQGVTCYTPIYYVLKKEEIIIYNGHARARARARTYICEKLGRY